jgi:membrane-associated protease RseP (regulator of RpoE activity)
VVIRLIETIDGLPMSISAWLAYFFTVLSVLLAHELGHWVQMYRLNIPLTRLTLGMGPSIRICGRLHLGIFPIGAAVAPDRRAWEAASNRDRFTVATGGPIASFIFGAVLLGSAILYPASLKGLSVMAWMHFVLGMANLVPVPPLDGWVAVSELSAILGRPLSPLAKEVANRAGSGLLYGLGFYLIGDLVYRAL